tara:strand:+ start:3640 stop:4299 length:660 start_codon:yes stop_codon:yes gene_type:complete
MKQERFNPSTNVSNWQGRSEYLKGYPGKAMSEALNGGFFGSGGQTPRERWTYINSGHGSGDYSVYNFNTATPKYDEILLTMNLSQGSNWYQDGYIYLNSIGSAGSFGQSAYWERGNWNGYDYGYETSRPITLRFGVGNQAAQVEILVTNCASTTQYKPFKWRHSFGNNTYQNTSWGYGVLYDLNAFNSYYIYSGSAPWAGNNYDQGWAIWGGRRAGEEI